MSKVDLSAYVNGIGGKVGNNTVFRRVGKRTILAQRPKKKENPDPVKESVRLQRDKFRRAAAFARAKMNDQAAKEEYRMLAQGQEFMSPFTAAVRDYLRPIEFSSVKTVGYTGKVGDKIVVQPMDYRKVKELVITILRQDASVVESGAAVLPEGELDWTYTATQVNDQLVGGKVVIRAMDRSGKEAVVEVNL